MNDLKPCPFCGGEAKPTAHLEYGWWAPVCSLCGVRGPSVKVERGSNHQQLQSKLEEANAKWNRVELKNVMEKNADRLIYLVMEVIDELAVIDCADCAPDTYQGVVACIDDLREVLKLLTDANTK